MAPPKQYTYRDNADLHRKDAPALFGAVELPALPPAPPHEAFTTSTSHGKRDITYVMSVEEERQRFLEFNFAKLQCNRAIKNKTKGKRGARFWAGRVRHLEEYLIRVNLPLVYAQAARLIPQRFSNLEWNEGVSEGQLGLARAVNGFDLSFGFKLSTYACRIIINSMSSASGKKRRKSNRLPTIELIDSMGGKVGQKDDHQESVDNVQLITDIMKRNAANLSMAEQTVISRRFFERVTLEEVGKGLGVSKERVRQIQNKALAKLRVVVADRT